MAKRSKRKVKPAQPDPMAASALEEAISSNSVWPSRQQFLQALVLVVAGFAVYSDLLHADWLKGWDDDQLIISNGELRDFHGLWQIWFGPPVTDYWPLTWSLFWMEWHLFGLNPLGYHVCSLGLHLFSGFLVWQLLAGLGLRWAWLGGLFFVVHPLSVESVAWISETKNTLSLCFYLLSLNAWIKASHDPADHFSYRCSIVYYLAAMLSKTSTVMLPVVLLLYYWWKRSEITWPELKKTIPFFAIAVILGLVTLQFQSNSLLQEIVEKQTIAYRLISAALALSFYFEKFLLPIQLVPIYPRLDLGGVSFLQFTVFVLIIALVAGSWLQRHGWGRHALLGFGFFVINLLPVLGLLDMTYLNNSWVADHFVYLPMIGLIGLAVAGLEMLSRRLPLITLPALKIATALLTLFWAWESHAYAKIFADEKRFWTYTYEHSPSAYAPYENLGAILLQAGQKEEARRMLAKALQISPNIAEAHVSMAAVLINEGQSAGALQELQAAMILAPHSAKIHSYMGIALLQAKRVPEAIEELKEALVIDPNEDDARDSLAQALAQSGQIDEAIEQYQKAINLNPNLAEPHYALGTILLNAGRLPEAEQQLTQALSLKPDFVEAHLNLANLMLARHQLPEALSQYEQALKLDPSSAEAHHDIASALLQAGRIPEAVEQDEQALKLTPQDAQAQLNLASSLLQAGRVPEAIQHCQQALQIDPGNARAHDSMAIALMQSGQIPEAIRHFEQAIQLDPNVAAFYYDYGNALLQTNRFSDAIQEFRLALKINPDYAEAHNNCGAALMNSGHAAESLEEFKKALAIDPNFTDAQQNLTQAEIALKAKPDKH